MARCALRLLPLLSVLLVSQVLGAPIPPPKQPSLQVAFCIDVTKDVEAAFAAFRRQFRTLVAADEPGPAQPLLRIALVAFRDRGDELVTRVVDFSEGPRAVELALRELRAVGGGDAPEGVNLALFEAVHLLSWGVERGADRRIILIGSAPPHSDYEEDVPHSRSCQEAAARGIVVHAVQIGADAECAECWREIARATGGKYRHTESDRLIADLVPLVRPVRRPR